MSDSSFGIQNIVTDRWQVVRTTVLALKVPGDPANSRQLEQPVEEAAVNVTRASRHPELPRQVPHRQRGSEQP